MAQYTHENYKTKTHTPEIGSNRAFGITFGVVCLLLSTVALYHGKTSGWCALVVATLFFCAAFFKPKVLKPLNSRWFRFGLLLHALINPLLMGILFFIVLTPMALICKMLGKDLLKCKFQKDKQSYWIARDDRSQFKNQF